MRMRNTWSFIFYLGRAQSPLNCPTINILEYLFTENELKLLTPGGGGHLPPASLPPPSGDSEALQNIASQTELVTCPI